MTLGYETLSIKKRWMYLLSQNRNFCPSNDTVVKVKRQAMDQEKRSATHITAKTQVLITYKEFVQIDKKNTNYQKN